MIKTNNTGTGTVAQTIYDELLTPLNTQKKIITQTDKQATKAYPENIDGSPSSYSLHVSSTDRITSILKNYSALDTSSISQVHLGSLAGISNDHGSGLKNATIT